MRLTVEEDRESIKRYAHIRPGRAWGGALCSAGCPGSVRTCTLDRNHRGPHVAHGLFRRVVAVWDAGSGARPPGAGGSGVGPRKTGTVGKREDRGVKGPSAPKEVWTGGVSGPLTTVWNRMVALVPSIGEIAALVLFIAFVAFSIYWATLIL